MFYTQFNSSIGSIILKGTHKGITNLYIDNGSKTIPINDRWIKSDNIFAEAKKQLLEYLSGTRQQFQLNLTPQGTEFQQKIWAELTKIPFGEVRSYKQIAIAAGNENASRAVGMAKNQVNALFQNPDNKNFELCTEQTLRKFLDGLIPYKRGPKPDYTAKPKLKRKDTFQKLVPEKRPPAQKDEA